MLNTVLALRQPSDYDPSQGARFEVHFEKARGFQGADARPFEASLSLSGCWSTRSVQDVEQDRVAALHATGLNVREIADELGMSKSAVGRLLQRARDEAAGG